MIGQKGFTLFLLDVRNIRKICNKCTQNMQKEKTGVPYCFISQTAWRFTIYERERNIHGMWEGKTNGCVGTSYYKFQWITLSTQKKRHSTTDEENLSLKQRL